MKRAVRNRHANMPYWADAQTEMTQAAKLQSVKYGAAAAIRCAIKRH